MLGEAEFVRIKNDVFSTKIDVLSDDLDGILNCHLKLPR